MIVLLDRKDWWVLEKIGSVVRCGQACVGMCKGRCVYLGGEDQCQSGLYGGRGGGEMSVCGSIAKDLCWEAEVQL